MVGRRRDNQSHRIVLQRNPLRSALNQQKAAIVSHAASREHDPVPDPADGVSEVLIFGCQILAIPKKFLAQPRLEG